MLQNRIFSIGLLLALLTGCGSTPRPPQVSVTQPRKNIINSEVTTPETLLAKAEQADDPADYFLQLTQLVADSDCVKALEIAELTEPYLTKLRDIQQSAMIRATCFVDMGRYKDAEAQLAQIPDTSDLLEQKHSMLFEVYSAMQKWWPAANALYLSTQRTRENDEQIWAVLQRLSDKQLTRHLSEISALNPLLQLLHLQRQLSRDYTQTIEKINAWQNRYAQHSFAQQLPKELQQIISQSVLKPKNVLVLLPLSGPRKAQGEAIKEGILAANYSSDFRNRQFRFIDTAPWSEGQFSMPDFSEVDLVIGPLLKENIDQLQPGVPPQLPVLFLNRTDLQISAENHYFYSLAPEDEALQLSNLLQEKGIKQPLLIAADSATYQRMKLAFIDAWSQSSDIQPVILDFSDNNAVREGVNERLALTDSKTRVRQISNLLRPELHSFERNRRDIDAIVIFANATQTELINPLIEASTSPFAAIIPVYATSRSFSRNLSENDLRDLRNLYFIEMPWMLNEKEFAWMRKRADQIWPARRDPLQRLFAMGYDALNMAPYLPLLDRLENQSWTGLTGEIRLNSSNQTQRHTTPAQFSEQEIKILVGD